MKSKSKLKYIRTTGRQIKNCTANKAISTTDAVRRIDRRTKTDKKTDNQTDGMTTRNQTDRQTNRQRTKRTERQTPTNKRTTNIFFHYTFCFDVTAILQIQNSGQRQTHVSVWLTTVGTHVRESRVYVCSILIPIIAVRPLAVPHTATRDLDNLNYYECTTWPSCRTALHYLHSD